VEFSIVTNSANEEWVGIGAILQADLAQLGMKVSVTPLEYRGLLDRVLHSYDYEAAILALGPSDVDPVSEMNVWLSSGRTNLWNLSSGAPIIAWEAEVDRLMRQQLVELDPGRRKQRYARLQRILAEHLPMIFLVSPHLLAAAKSGLRNFRPAVLSRDSLWNIEELYWSDSR
jgi:peptide/nickel transport system substrate-binding protein